MADEREEQEPQQEPQQRTATERLAARPGLEVDESAGAVWLDTEIMRLRNEVEQLLEWQIVDLTAKLGRMKADGALLFETIGDEIHSYALEIDRRIAAIVTLQRTNALLVALGELPAA